MSGLVPPPIPAGAQLGGSGTQANQAQVQAPNTEVQAPIGIVQQPTVTEQNDVPPVPVRDPVTGQWVLPVAEAPAQPTTPLIQQPVTPTAVPQGEAVQQPVIETKSEDEPTVGATYLETTTVNFAQEIGVDVEAIGQCIEKALEHGDDSLITIDHLGTLTPAQAARARQLAAEALAYTKAEIESNDQLVYNTAGGIEKWTPAINAFNAGASKEAQVYIEHLINNVGTKAAIKEAAEYVIKYVTESGLITNIQKPAIQGGTGAPVATGLTKQEYMDGVHVLELQRNSRQITQGQYDASLQDLDYRRSVGRSQGR